MKIELKKRFSVLLTALLMICALLPVSPAKDFLAASLYEYVPNNSTNTSSYFTAAGSLTTNGGTQSYNGMSLAKALKMDSSGSIKFTTSSAGATLVVAINANKTGSALSLNGDTSAISSIDTTFTTKTITLGAAGTYTLAKGSNECYVYYVSVSEGSSATTPTTAPTAAPTAVPTTTPSVTTSGRTTGLKDKADSAFKNVVYCAPNAAAGQSGTSQSPMKLEEAITLAESKPGITILLKSGTYSFSNQLTISQTNNGTASSYKVLKAAYGATVKLDFSSQSYNKSDTSVNARGLQMNGSYWYICGINFYGAADNGVMLSGNNNVFENCIFEANRDTGLQISRRDSSQTTLASWPSNNLILNCTSFDNNDPATGENADGFAAKLTCGSGNVFDGCISYNNVDDGWDLYAKTETGPIGVVTLKNCIAFRNGATSAGVFTANSDGNGFKLGGSGVGTSHVVENCIAFSNKKHGFTDNNNPNSITLKNCTSYKNGAGDSNGANFQMDRTTNGGTYTNLLNAGLTGSTSDKFIGTISNSIFYNSQKWLKVTSATAINKDKPGTETTAPASSSFMSVSAPAIGTSFHTLWRNADGTVNTNGFLVPSSSASFTNMGAYFGTSGTTYAINVNLN